MTATFDQCIDVSNSLLRGELSAVETYTQALAKFRTEPERSLLRSIRADHQDSVGRLRAHIDDMGVQPDESSGVWGQFAKAVEGFAKVFGHTTTLMALEAGELSGIDDYLVALDDPEVMDEIKQEIREVLLPRLERHLDALRKVRAK
ncbi:DUF2383 domain-containing protein [Luteolibacter sp. Populi]|uniref:DUF2383 domain-containing protein n=1 Tax=Luteolibacter sp. Populi TaxID=3230487 RepID=UPI0034660346